jgi:hypothetical protein
MRNRLVSIQSKNRKRLGSIAQKKCPMVLGVNCHSMVVAAAFNWVTSQHGIGCRVDFGNFVGISQVHVHLAGDGVILGHAGFAFEFESS